MTMFTFRSIGEHAIVVDAACGCGPDIRTFRGVATIVNPLAPNPGIHIPRPLGAQLVGRICEAVKSGQHLRVESIGFIGAELDVDALARAFAIDHVEGGHDASDD